MSGTAVLVVVHVLHVRMESTIRSLACPAVCCVMLASFQTTVRPNVLIVRSIFTLSTEVAAVKLVTTFHSQRLQAVNVTVISATTATQHRDARASRVIREHSALLQTHHALHAPTFPQLRPLPPKASPPASAMSGTLAEMARHVCYARQARTKMKIRIRVKPAHHTLTRLLPARQSRTVYAMRGIPVVRARHAWYAKQANMKMRLQICARRVPHTLTRRLPAPQLPRANVTPVTRVRMARRARCVRQERTRTNKRIFAQPAQTTPNHLPLVPPSRSVHAMPATRVEMAKHAWYALRVRMRM